MLVRALRILSRPAKELLLFQLRVVNHLSQLGLGRHALLLCLDTALQGQFSGVMEVREEAFRVKTAFFRP
jgi:hypothetical protein